MKKLIEFIRSLFDTKYFVDAGVIDYSGQGRNKYGK